MAPARSRRGRATHLGRPCLIADQRAADAGRGAIGVGARGTQRALGTSDQTSRLAWRTRGVLSPVVVERSFGTSGGPRSRRGGGRGGGDSGSLSLAAGVLPEFEPPEVVSAAAAAGFGMVGVWFDPETWSAARAREVRRRLDGTGLVALDMEPIFVTPGGDHGERLIDAAAEVGARHVLSVSRGLEPARFADRFGELCDHAAPAGITVVVEPTLLYSVTTLAEARQVVALAGRPNGAILVDNLHLDRAGRNRPDALDGRPDSTIPADNLHRDRSGGNLPDALDGQPNGTTSADNLHRDRSGGNPPDALAGQPSSAILADTPHLDRAGGDPLEALRRVDPALLPYAQLCDAPARPADTSRAGLIADARDERRLLGEGGLPVRDFVAALPDGIPLSLEIRSRKLRRQYPDPADRAARVHANATRYLSSSPRP